MQAADQVPPRGGPLIDIDQELASPLLKEHPPRDIDLDLMNLRLIGMPIGLIQLAAENSQMILAVLKENGRNLPKDYAHKTL